MNLNLSSQIVVLMLAFFMAIYDFKSDTRRLEWMKSLPIRSSCVVLGQLTVSSLYIASFIIFSVLMNYGILIHYLPQKHISNSYFVFLVLSLPLGVFYISTANALFLLVPSYDAERSTAFGVFQVLCSVALTVGMLEVLTLVFTVCTILAKYLGNSQAVYFSMLVIIVMGLAALAFRTVVWAYERFDVSRVSR